MKDVHCIDEPLSFKLPINHGRQTVKLTIDFCQRVASSSEKREEPGGTKKTSRQPQCQSQRGCGKNVAKTRGPVHGKNVAKSRGAIPELSCQPEPTSPPVYAASCHQPVPLATVLPWTTVLCLLISMMFMVKQGCPFTRAAT